MNFSSEDNFTKNVEDISWQEYLRKWGGMFQTEWILRGQSFEDSKKISLQSSFERALNSYKIPLSKASEIEKMMIRDFQRKYEGVDAQIVFQDTFYCLSLMQHYGCPTRLLDFTYSPYIDAFFAVENMSIEQVAKRKAFIFCFRHRWLNDSARKNIDDDNLFKMRFHDKTANDVSFNPLYMKKNKKFIVADTPFQLHRRLSIQRGVFLIQGDIKKKMMENIKSMDGWENEKNVIIYNLKIDTGEDLKKVYEDLRLMNITHESLFPGLDGFSKSLKQNLYLYQDLKDIKTKTNPFSKDINKKKRN